MDNSDRNRRDQLRATRVTEAQIVELSLPTRPTKTTDSRSRSFRGDSVEVDAIPTSVLRQIVGDAIEWWINPRKLALNTGNRSIRAA